MTESAILYPTYEIIKVICICGKEIPLYSYDDNFFDYLGNFLKHYPVSEKTKKNLFQRPDIDNLSLCCKSNCRFGKTFSIPVEKKIDHNEKGKQITSIPSPLSDNENLVWV